MRDLKLTSLNNYNTVVVGLSGANQISGADNLVQKIVKCLLTNKDSNQFYSGYGSQFFSLYKTINTDLIDKVKQAIPIIIDDVATQIKTEQLEQINNGVILSNSEILDSLEIDSIEFDELFGGWVVKLIVNTKSSTINITLP